MASIKAKNKTIKKLLDEQIITQEQFEILFEAKDTWYTDHNGKQNWNTSEDKIAFFYETFEYILNLFDVENITDLSYIHFPPFEFQKHIIVTSQGINFQKAIFYGIADFTKIVFSGHADFWQSTFNDEALFVKSVFTSKARFVRTTFCTKSNFSMSEFLSIADFREAVFQSNSIFHDAIFRKKTNFKGVVFRNNANFRNTNFSDIAYFRNVKFSNLADFSSCGFAQKLILRDSKIGILKLDDIEVENPNFLNMSAYHEECPNGKILTKVNFANKETVRLIKAHLEMQNNITESNKYFALEQELYLDELLKPISTEPNKWQTIITLFLNQYVSHFGTDWLRSLMVLIITGYIVIMGYMGLDAFGYLENDKDNSIKHFAIDTYWAYSLLMIIGWGFIYNYTLSKNKYMVMAGLSLIGWIFFIANIYNLEPRAFTNYIVQITNPIGAFKDVELYKGIEFYATIVRITIAVMIYQLIVAFRNNTRRS